MQSTTDRGSASCSSSHLAPHLTGHQRRLNIAWARNPYKEARLDMISGGTPNTAVRRLSYTIKHAITLTDLCRLIQRNRPKMTGGVWLDKHEAAILDRAADLSYNRAMHAQGEGDVLGDGKALRDTLEEVMQLSARRSLRSPVVKLLEGRTILRLLSSLAHAECSPSRLPMELLAALVMELARSGGNKMPRDGASMAELYWCIAVLGLLPDWTREPSKATSDHSFAPGPRNDFYYHRPASPSDNPRLNSSAVLQPIWMELERSALLALQKELVDPRMDVEDLAKIAWATSVMGKNLRGLSGSSSGKDLMGHIEKIGLKILQPIESHLPDHQGGGGELDRREARLVANLAYAFGKGGRRCPELMARISQTFARHLSTGIDQEENQGMREGSRLEMRRSRSHVSGSSVAKLMWAMASLGHKDLTLLHRLSVLVTSPHSMSRMNLTADELAHIIWSFSTMQHHKPQVFEALGRAFMSSRMFDVSDNQLAMIATSFVPLASSPSISPSVISGVYRTISRLASARADTMNVEDLVEIVWSLANVRDPNSLLLQVVTKSAISSMSLSLSSLRPGTTAKLLLALKQSKEIGLTRELSSFLHNYPR